ncbi:translocon at the outer envelope membrane ofchloroplasts 159, partial [Striga asiatica]
PVISTFPQIPNQQGRSALAFFDFAKLHPPFLKGEKTNAIQIVSRWSQPWGSGTGHVKCLPHFSTDITSFVLHNASRCQIDSSITGFRVGHLFDLIFGRASCTNADKIHHEDFLTREASCEPNVIESPLETILEHCLIPFSEPISISSRRVRFYLDPDDADDDVDGDVDDDDDDDDVIEDEADEEDDEVDAVLLPEPATISESNHIWANTWHMPSSTSGLRFGINIKSSAATSRRRRKKVPGQTFALRTGKVLWSQAYDLRSVYRHRISGGAGLCNRTYETGDYQTRKTEKRGNCKKSVHEMTSFSSRTVIKNSSVPNYLIIGYWVIASMTKKTLWMPNSSHATQISSMADFTMATSTHSIKPECNCSVKFFFVKIRHSILYQTGYEKLI